MATLTNTKIKDTYDGLLKTTNNEAIGASGVTLIEDGLGNASALSVGRANNGVTITGNLAVDTNTLYVDAANNRVGVGTSSPANSLEVNSGGNNNVALFESTDSAAYIDIKDNTGYGRIVSGNSGDMWFAPNGSEAMRIDSSGNVGINESNPDRKLHITDTSAGDVTYPIRVQNSGTTTGTDVGILFTTKTASAGSSTCVIRSESEDTSGNNSLVFTTPSGGSTSERMRIDSSGNVGIGGSPITKLTLEGVRNTNTLTLRSTSNDSGWSSGDEFGAIEFYSNDQSGGGVGVKSAISCVTTSSSGANSELVFSTSSTGTNNVERMRITSVGDVLIGTDSTLPSKGIAMLVDTTSGIVRVATNTTSADALCEFFNPNGKVGQIVTTGTATSYVTSSDYRLKENVVEMTGSLDRVDALKPSRFNFIADPEKTVDGFLAHEVQAVIPEAVNGEKDAVDEEGNPIYQGIDQSKIVPLLVGAIQELRAEIELLKNK